MKDEITPLLAQDTLSTEARDLLSALGPTQSMPPSAQEMLQARIETIAASPVTGIGAWPIGGTVVLLSLLVTVGAVVGLQTASETTLEGSSTVLEPVQVMSSRGFAAVRLIPEPDPTPKPKVAVVKKRPPVAQEAGGLAEELKLLRAAKRLLSTAPQSVLKQVKLHEQRFPNGQLLDMRDYLRLRALVLLDRSETSVQIRSFLDAYPNSPFRKDVLRLEARSP